MTDFQEKTQTARQTVGETSQRTARFLLQIFVVTLNGKIKTLTFRHMPTVLSIKRSISRLEGIPPDQQRLIHLGRQLENGRSAEEYSIREESTLHLNLRLRGC